VLRGFSAPVTVDDDLTSNSAWRKWRTIPTRSRAGKPAKPLRAPSCSAKRPRHARACRQRLAANWIARRKTLRSPRLHCACPILNELILTAPKPDPEALFAAREALRRRRRRRVARQA
jgi:hypothetical protein